ncbi:ABC transporter permease [Lactobacillus sp. XV13L]|nr:ABC transporter permease [Lactobacillus sp. XV13L]
MFLAIKEIKREKLRYGLIILMIFLISYLIFVLSSLAVGLASQNTQALESWGAKQVVLNKNANVNMSQSVLTKEDLKDAKITKDEALVGQTPVVVKDKKRPQVSSQFIGVKKSQFIYANQGLIAGRRAKKDTEIVVDQAFKIKGYKLGDKLELNGSKTKYRIVGFVKNAKINIAPITYGTLSSWKKLRRGMPDMRASAIISRRQNFRYNHKDGKTYPVKTFISKLPGYTAQNMTFELMIGFLFVISLIIIAVFLYILTIQKMHNYAVMRAQGIPSSTLVNATISQSVILVVCGVVLGLLALAATAKLLPAAVPMSFTPQIIVSGTVGLLLMGVIGSLIPVRSILKVDPVKAIGE